MHCCPLTRRKRCSASRRKRCSTVYNYVRRLRGEILKVVAQRTGFSLSRGDVMLVADHLKHRISTAKNMLNVSFVFVAALIHVVNERR